MVWEPGTATGLGPFPGVDPLEAARIVLSEFPLPFLPELPARGVGADAVGRTAGLLADLHVEVGTGVWRFVPRGGRDEQRALTTLTTDLDALEETADGYEGPLKVRIVGPWSLAASIELPRGEKALADPGAVRDIAASLTEGLTRHLANIRRRLPALTRLVVQVDEPLLPAVVAGELATASGWGKLRSYERSVVEDGLRQVLGSLSRSTAHITVERDGEPDGDGRQDLVGVWLGSAHLDGAMLRDVGAGFIGIDGAVLDRVDEDEIGEAIDAGLGLLVAAVPLEAQQSDPRPVMAPVTSLWKRLGFRAEELSRTVAVTPVEGLEQLDIGAVPAVLKRAVEAARYLDEFAAEEAS
ncbi:MAG TPA: methionine synthase [Acidimicrobiia bacterium]|nr:methionine synthase [Acidimicrobiia bacterium]